MKLETIFVASHPIQAHVVRTFLEAEGIPAMVQGEHLSSMLGYAPSLTVTVCVRADDASQALDLLGEFLEEADEFTKCAECGQVLDGSTEQCWRCGQSVGPGAM